MRTILLASATVLALSQVALAQNSNNNQSPNSATQTPPTQQHLGADLKNMLQKSGYTDIRLAPTASSDDRVALHCGTPIGPCRSSIPR